MYWESLAMLKYKNLIVNIYIRRLMLHVGCCTYLYPSYTASVKPNLQCSCNFVVINASEGSLCFQIFISYFRFVATNSQKHENKIKSNFIAAKSKRTTKSCKFLRHSICICVCFCKFCLCRHTITVHEQTQSNRTWTFLILPHWAS
jgi:hypothetical protein